MALTDQQAAILNATASGISVQGVAGPGCGKTFLLMEYCKAHANDVGTLLAYGSDIAAELSTRIPEGARWHAKTTHQFGKAAIPGRPRIDGKGLKLRGLFDESFKSGPYERFRREILTLTGTLREYAYGFPEGIQDADIPELMMEADLGVEPEFEELVITAAIRLVHACDADTSTVDFADMLRQPVLRNYDFPRLQWIGIDEMQDWSILQRLLLTQALRASPTATLLGVGDPKQAIYAFRGADPKSFERLREAFNLVSMPLNKTWRCPAAVCAEANRIYPGALIPMSARQGSVTSIARSVFDETMFKRLHNDTLVICRTNAPLFKVARKCLEARFPIRIKPRFCASLEALIRRAKATSIPDLLAALQDLRLKDLAHASTPTAELAINDKYDGVIACAEGLSTVRELLDLLRTLTQGKTGPRLLTGHGCKGLEGQDVYILRPDLMPHPSAKTEIDCEQEQNIKFVAVTRAIERLHYVWEDKEPATPQRTTQHLKPAAASSEDARDVCELL